MGTELGHFDMLADMELFAAAQQILAFDEWSLEEIGLEEPWLRLFCDLTELPHVVVEVEEVAFAVIERHGDDVGLEDLHVFRAELAVDALVFDLLGNVAGGVGDIAGLEVLELEACQSAEPDPVGVFHGA